MRRVWVLGGEQSDRRPESLPRLRRRDTPCSASGPLLSARPRCRRRGVEHLLRPRCTSVGNPGRSRPDRLAAVRGPWGSSGASPLRRHRAVRPADRVGGAPELAAAPRRPGVLSRPARASWCARRTERRVGAARAAVEKGQSLDEHHLPLLPGRRHLPRGDGRVCPRAASTRSQSRSVAGSTR
jgi:hypothetical protein